ncbi:MAG: 4-aminobutyraldehyde dehydrogenase, partial [uncultured Solirubrobacteraceae bacterium]
GRRVRRRDRRRDVRRRQPGERRAARRGARLLQRRRRPRRRGRQARLRVVREHHAGRSRGAAARARRHDRRARRGARHARDRQRRQADRDDEGRRGPGDVGLPAVLRGRGADDAGPDGGRVPRGLHVVHPPRADRRRRPDHAVELPADDGDLEDRPGARGRQHDRHEAGRDDAAVDAAVRRARVGDPPEGRAQRRRRDRLDRRGAGPPPGRRDGRADRLGRVGQEGRRRRGGHAQARAPRARRQGAGRHLRRRGHGGRRGDDRGHRLLQRRPGLHRRDARPRVAEGVRQRGQRAGRPGQGPDDGRHARRVDDARAAQQRASARARRGLPRAQGVTRRDRHRRARARPAGLLPRADRRRRPPAERRDDPARDLRPRHHRPTVQRRGRGDRLGQRHPVRPRVLGVDPRRRPGAARREGDQVRLRVDQRPHRAGQRDAARRLQAVGVRQGPLDVRAGGLHRGQARHGVARL